MSPKLTLTYFNLAGPAEPIRWALEKGGLDWEDRRLSNEEFAALKPSLPYGQVPVLDIDGNTIAQSAAILRYVGKLAGLYPSGDFEAAKCDSVMDCAADLLAMLRPSIHEKDQEKKMEMRKTLADDKIPTWLSNMDKQLGSTDGIFFAEQMSVADIVIATSLKMLKDGYLDGIPSNITESYPLLTKMYEAVLREPKIAAFVAKHAK